MAKKTFFHYGNDKIEVDEEELTGAEIKAAIKAAHPEVDVAHDLILEGRGDEADTVIADGTPVDLGHGHGGGPKKFYLRPPTDFGRG